MNPKDRRRVSFLAAAVVLAAVVAVLGGLAISYLVGRVGEFQPPDDDPPVTVHLFVPPESVDHDSRFRFSFDSPEILASLRHQEQLDQVVEGATTDEEAWRRLMDWTAAQWEEGIPDPYPPPDARVILRDIRSGFTGGFCAQFCFVLVQAIQSFGAPSRHITIDGHEVVEAWLDDQQRWVMLDPTYRLQVLDSEGGSLNALEIRRRVEQGRAESLRLSEGHRAPESAERYLVRYREFAVWIRNDLVSRPMNFTDFDRYRVWFEPREPTRLPPVSLSTSVAEDLYPGIGRLAP